MLNAYFNNYGFAREQDILEDLILESIKIYGHEVKYLPRTRVATDHLFGEDPLSKFDEAINVEMYVKSVEGFEGDGQFLSKFGLEIRDQVVLTVARKRFDQAITSPKIMSEVGYNIIFEDGDNDEPSRKNLKGSQATESWVQEGDDYVNTLNRPQEGDLIFIPVVEKIFEIQHVDYTPTFYQTGRLQTYDIRCEVFEYSSEQISTGNTVIDAIETEYTLDALRFQLTLEEALDRAFGSVVLSTPQGSISSVTVTDGGVYGSTPPTITLSDPESRSNTAASLFQASPYPQGTGYSNGVATTSYSSGTGPGTGLTVQIVTNEFGVIQSLPTIVDPGKNYRNSDVLTVDGGDNATFLVISTSDVTAQVANLEVVMSGNNVSSVTVNDGGAGYFTGTTITFSQETVSGVLRSEDGGTFLQEFQIETQDRSANNSFYTSSVAMDGIIDFSEQNPFGEIDRY